MPDKKISELDAAGVLDGNESVPIVQAGANKRVSISDLLEKQHGHAISDVTGLQTALDGKSNTGHGHDDMYYTESEVDALLAGTTGDNLIIGTVAPTPGAGESILWLDTTGGNITLNLVTG